MRSMLMGTMMAAVVTTAATSGSAGEPPINTPAQRPRIVLAPPVRVVGFHRPPGQTGPYTGGPLALAGDVENTGDVAAEGVVVKLASGDAAMNATLSIPARSTRTVLVQDSVGIESSCQPKLYAISLAGTGTSERVRNARITPACTFSSTLEETWNKMSPDRVEAEKAGTVYLSRPSIAAAPTCQKAAPSIKVSVVSQAAKSSPSLIVQAKEWTALAPVKAQTAAAFPIAPNELKEVVLTPVANVSKGGAEPASKMKLTIVDWTKSLGGRTSDGGIFVKTTRSCALDLSLLP